MLDWKRLRDIRELRWALAGRVPVLTSIQVGEAALSILHSMVSAHSDLDDAGEIVTPTPRVKRILSGPRCLPHIAQAMLSGEPSTVEVAAALLKAIVTRNPKSMIRLYSTGAFYFALTYPGSNLLSIAQLFSVTHVHQAYLTKTAEEEKEPHFTPTRKNIQEALQWLVQGCQPRDSLVFYYSGHGLRQLDFNQDERDGFDETLCPVDFKKEGMILDNDISTTIIRLLKKGVTLHAIIDACHSGNILDLIHVYDRKKC